MSSYVKRGKVRRGVPAAHEGDVSDAQKDVFFSRMEADFEPSVKTSCQAAGITKRQYDALVASDKAFVGRLREFREKQLDDMEDALFRAASTDTNLAWKLLQANRPEKYGSKAKLDVTHNIRSPEDLRGLTDEEFAALLQERGCP
jgi:hypothetical protein